MRLIVAIVSISLAGVASGQTPPGLVGTWQLVSRVDTDPSGKRIADPSLGAHPVGYIIYDNSGHVAVQLMAKDRSANPCEVTAPSSANNLAHIGGYDAYFGRFEVDAAAGTVTHILEGALSPADVGRRLTRRFKLDGDTLTIQFEPGGTGDPKITRTLVLHRVTH
jgi:hypothetical protein